MHSVSFSSLLLDIFSTMKLHVVRMQFIEPVLVLKISPLPQSHCTFLLPSHGLFCYGLWHCFTFLCLTFKWEKTLFLEWSDLTWYLKDQQDTWSLESNLNAQTFTELTKVCVVLKLVVLHEGMTGSSTPSTPACLEQSLTSSSEVLITYQKWYLHNRRSQKSRGHPSKHHASLSILFTLPLISQAGSFNFILFMFLSLLLLYPM